MQRILMHTFAVLRSFSRVAIAGLILHDIKKTGMGSDVGLAGGPFAAGDH
jgi:hypothetical protein